MPRVTQKLSVTASQALTLLKPEILHNLTLSFVTRYAYPTNEPYFYEDLPPAQKLCYAYLVGNINAMITDYINEQVAIEVEKRVPKNKMGIDIINWQRSIFDGSSLISDNVIVLNDVCRVVTVKEVSEVAA